MSSAINDPLSHFEGLSSDQQNRLSELLDGYMLDLEQGRPVDREQLVARHPDLAQALAVYLESMEFLQDAAVGFAAAGESIGMGEAVGCEAGQLGDFQLVRELGRGGMGIVYEAGQISLDRRVALKVLPFAALLDSKQIVRFRNEAQAAAQLHHSNIVPVFFVGVERGVHYYAMQLIEGESLDRAIEGLRHAARIQEESVDRSDQSVLKPLGTGRPDRQPSASYGSVGTGPLPLVADSGLKSTILNLGGNGRDTDAAGYFRTVARLGVQAAEALHCAHEFGIVHRDVKPSNLLLDSEGKLWVTDFGLARFRSDAGLTQSGEFVGTIRYMSPEQARGDSHLVDHRTDIYSLGVTLYELLTLKHPVRAQRPAAILLELERESPYRPTLWNSRIPSDLENIVQKAMSKSRDERYGTAQELADDLRRFLDGKVTVAKRPTIARRAVKWVRRHQALTLFLAVLMMTVLGLLVSTGMLARQKRETEAALAKAESSYQQYRTQLALSASRLALLHDRHGNASLAQAAFEEAIQLQRETLTEHPEDEAMLRGLAVTLTNFSYFCAQHDLDQAVKAYDEALKLQRRLVDLRPKHGQYRNDLALTYSNYGSFLARQSEPELAVAAYRKAIAALHQTDVTNTDTRTDLAIVYNNLGMAQDSLGLVVESEKSFRQALKTLQASALSHSTTPVNISRLGGIYNNLGMVLERQERWQDAVSSYDRAIECQSKAAGLAPQVTRFHDLLSTHQENLSRAMRELDADKVAVRLADM